MPRRSATTSIIGFVTQPSCSWPRHRMGITAEAWRPGGYFSIWRLAQASFSALKAKLAGCSRARRRNDMLVLFREIDAGDQPILDCVDRDDLEAVLARPAADILVVHHRVADMDARIQPRVVLRKV